MKTIMARYAVIGLGVILAASVAAAGGAKRIVVPPGVAVPNEVRTMLRNVMGPRHVISPLVELSTGTGACGSPDHAPAAQYPLATLNDLYFCTSWLPIEGIHLQSIDIIAPDGNFYQKIQIPFEMPGPAFRRVPQGRVKKVILEGRTVPHEVRMLVKDTASGLNVLQGAFPVAGSYITGQSLVGRWSVNVYLDYDKVPLAAGSFEIVQ